MFVPRLLCLEWWFVEMAILALEQVSMGWWLLRLSAKILALLRLSVNFFQLRLKINFFCFK